MKYVEMVVDNFGNSRTGDSLSLAEGWELLTTYEAGMAAKNFKIFNDNIAQTLLKNIWNLGLSWCDMGIIDRDVFNYEFDENRLCRWLFKIWDSYTYFTILENVCINSWKFLLIHEQYLQVQNSSIERYFLIDLIQAIHYQNARDEELAILRMIHYTNIWTLYINQLKEGEKLVFDSNNSLVGVGKLSINESQITISTVDSGKIERDNSWIISTDKLISTDPIRNRYENIFPCHYYKLKGLMVLDNKAKYLN